jgi:hypothetical protein
VKVFEANGLPDTTGTYFVRCSLYVNGKTFIKSETAKETADKKQSTQKLRCHDFEGESFIFGETFEFGNVPVSLFVEIVEKKITFGSLFPAVKTIGMTEIKLQDVDREPSTVARSYSLEPSKVKTAAGKSPINAKRALSSDQLGKIKLTVNWTAPSEDGGGSHGSGDSTPFDLEALGIKEADEDAETEPDKIPDFEPNILILRIMGADELRVMDKSWAGGSSDPRVKVKLDGKDAMTWKRPKPIDSKAQKVKTTTAKQNLQPVWNETFMIPCLVREILVCVEVLAHTPLTYLSNVPFRKI